MTLVLAESRVRTLVSFHYLQKDCRDPVLAETPVKMTIR